MASLPLFFFFKIYFLFNCLAVVGIHYCTWAFSSCSGGWGTFCGGTQASHCSGFP